MVKSANHGRVEVAELILVVANILLVAVWHLERGIVRFRFLRAKQGQRLVLLASPSNDTRNDQLNRHLVKLSQNSFMV